VINRLCRNKIKYNRLPDLYSRKELTVEAAATHVNPEGYTDSSSILVAVLLELTALFNSQDMFEELLKHMNGGLSLQIPNIKSQDYDVEQLIFERHLHNEYHVESIDRLAKSTKSLKEEPNFKAFRDEIISKQKSIPEYRTDKTGFDFLRYLTHSYYKNEILPEEWRILITK
jgi:hypothetical protein